MILSAAPIRSAAHTAVLQYPGEGILGRVLQAGQGDTNLCRLSHGHCLLPDEECKSRPHGQLLRGNTNQPPHRRGLSPYRQLVAYLPSSPPPCAAIPRTHTWCIGSHTAGLNYYLTTFYKWSGLLALAGVISGEYLETDTLLIQIRYPA